jgi:hypothetical protein
MQEVLGTPSSLPRGMSDRSDVADNADGDLTRHHVMSFIALHHSIKSRGFKRDRRWVRGLIEIRD